MHGRFKTLWSVKDAEYLDFLKFYQIYPRGSYWAYPKNEDLKAKDLPRQGFKIHISATILNALEIGNKILPTLLKNKISFKIARSLTTLQKLNDGRIGILK